MYLVAFSAKFARRLLLSATLLTTLVGCSYFQFPGVHKFHIQQGNIITQEMIDQLQPGMTKRQVAFVLGNPMLPDTFNQSRWDYYYSLKRPSGEFNQKHLTVFFDGDAMTHYTGDYQPSREGETATGAEDMIEPEFQEPPVPQDF